MSLDLYRHPRCCEETVPRMKVSGLSPSVLTNVFIAGTKNATGVCFREYLWRENTIPFVHRQRKSAFRTFVHVLYPVRIGRSNLARSLRFIPDSVFHSQSAVHSPRFTNRFAGFFCKTVLPPL